MSAVLSNLWTDIRSRLLADTGTGGLFATGSELVNGVWLVNAPDSQAFPYLIIASQASRQDDSMTSRHHVVQFQVSAYIDEEPGYDPFVRGSAIGARLLGNWEATGTRIPGYGLDRWTPALSGSGWTASMCVFIQTREQHEPGVLHFVHEFEVRVNKG
jgi:hypothetical protein